MLRMALLRRSRSRSVPEVSPEAGTWLGMRHLAGNALHGLKVAVTAASVYNDFLHVPSLDVATEGRATRLAEDALHGLQVALTVSPHQHN